MRVRLPLLLAALLISWAGRAAECLKIGVASGAVSTAAVARVADRIFSLAGSCAEILVMPDNRLTAMADTGELDGLAFKGGNFIAQHPDLMPSPTPVYGYTGDLYWPPGMAEPRGSVATVGIILGQLWPKAAARERGLAVFEVRSYEQMAEMTRNGRLQGFIMADAAFAQLLPRYDFLKAYNARAVAEISLHLVVNKRHQALLPALDRTIQELRARGEIEQELKAEDR